MNVALQLQRFADGTNAPVHHVAGGHHVGTCFGVVQGLAHQYFHGLIVEDVAGFIQDAVLAVAGVGIQCHVGHHAQLGEFLLQRADHAGDQAVGVEGFFAVGRFQAGINRGEQRQEGDLQLHAFLGHGQQQIQTQAVHARHGRHGLTAVAASVHKHRVDEVMG